MFEHVGFSVSYAMGTREEAYENPSYALFWVRDGLDGYACDVIEQLGSSRPVRAASERFNIFHTPDAKMLTETKEGGVYGLARVIPYDDRNRDGRRSGEEPFIGDSVHGIIYVPSALNERSSPVGLPLKAGFHVSGGLPVPCGTPERGDDESCNTDMLGEACFDDAVCGDDKSVCLHPDQGWENGYCALVADLEQGCNPPNASLYVENGPTKTGDLWLAACDKDADCRTREGYVCDQLLHACVPRERIAVVIGRDAPDKLCSDWRIGTDGNKNEPPSDCVPPDPRCDMMGPPGCVPPDPRCDGFPGNQPPPAAHMLSDAGVGENKDEGGQGDRQMGLRPGICPIPM